MWWSLRFVPHGRMIALAYRVNVPSCKTTTPCTLDSDEHSELTDWSGRVYKPTFSDHGLQF